ncbi:acid-sensing ion channel 1-like [Elysia marginata]|uniref:Acid-sensing ion channel 1-like n=1 Tax=Elysia marginata TaxID=1093978 RepID=A0AAV4JBR6_9GAST|nr:acid-sensing ion channel 1-like [Elysia marginata]
MAAFLTWALISLFLRYQEHPFVSVWGFQRESSTPPPGITLCIPAKYNKEKFNHANPAYRLLVFGGEVGIPMFDFWKSNLKGYEQYFYDWKRELENIGVKQAHLDIGFTKSELFWYSSLAMGNRSYELMDVLEELDGAEESCWKVNWFKLNTSVDLYSIEVDADADNETIDKDEHDYDYEVFDKVGDSYNNISSNQGVDYLNITANFTSMDTSILQNVPSGHNRTLDSTVSQNLLSTPSTQQTQQRSIERPTTSRTDGINSDEKAEEKKEDEEDEGGNASPIIGKFPEHIRLSQEDSITFLINIQQNNWLSTTHFAGLQVYLHDMTGQHWTEHPILLRPGTLSNIYYKTTKYKFLPLPYKSFGGIDTREKRQAKGNAGCVDTSSSSFKNPMISLPAELYSSETCIYEAIMNKSTKACGCSEDKFYNELHGTPRCSIWKYGQCFTRVMNTEYYRMQRQLAEGDDKDLPCPEACRMTKYESTVTTANYPAMEMREILMNVTGMSLVRLNDNVLMLSIQPQSPLSVTVEHVPELTLVGLVGSAGGWMGLCLGASLLSLTELFELLVMTAWIIYRKLARRLRAHT